MGRRRVVFAFASVFAVFAVFAGCNGILGIEEASLRDGSSGGPLADGDGNDGSTGDAAASDGSKNDALANDALANDAGDGALPDPGVCSPSTPKVIATTGTQWGPTLTYVGNAPVIWMLAWTNGSTIRSAAVDGTGNVIGPVATPITETTVSNVNRLLTSGLTPSLAYGFTNGTSGFTGLRTFTTPPSAVSAPAQAGDAGPNAAPDVGGMAIGKGVLVASREQGAGGTAAHATFYDASHVFQRQDTPTLTAKATAAGWAPGAGAGDGRFGLAYVDASGGSVAVYDKTFSRVGGLVSFTNPPAVPLYAAGAFDQVDMIGMGDQFAVVWIDVRAGSDVYLATVDPLLATRIGETRVTPAISGGATKYFPHVIWDGTTLVVSWSEEVTPGSYQVFARRYRSDLVSLDAARIAVNIGAGAGQQASFGMAASATRNEYGFAYLSLANEQYFNLLTCTGPI